MRFPDYSRLSGENFGIFKISATTYQGLISLGLVEKFEELPYDGLLGPFEEGTLAPEGLKRAVAILEAAANDLSDQPMDILCATEIKPEHIEYRMIIEPKEIKKDFREMASFFLEAFEKDFGVQLWL